MTTLRSFLPALLACLLFGCGAPAPDDGGAGEPPEPSAPPPADAGPPAQAETEDSGFLPTPFTAEQIRDEWIPGLTLVMKTDTAEGGALERWTVVAADAEGAEIEFLQIDAAGHPAGEARVTRSGWVELRDHASFPADWATREAATRDTALGKLDGWLYRVPDEAAGTVTEFFFATSLPGAPVHMAVLKDGQPVMTLAQIERQRPSPAG